MCILLVVSIELAAPHLLGGGESVLPNGSHPTGEPPGRGINYLALVDVFLLFVIGQYVVAQFGLGRLQGRVTGIVTFIGSIIMLIVGLLLLMLAIVEVLVMISLFAAVPFGTIAYLGIWGGFPRSSAGGTLGLMMTAQVVGLILLVLAHPMFVRQRGLLVLSGLSLVLKLVLGFLHAFVPRPVVAITDDIGAIVSAICGLIVAIFFLIVSLPSIVRVLRVDRIVTG